GDVDNDRYEDVVALGDQGLHLFKFGTNGAAMDITPFCRLNDAPAVDGALVDLDFTGKLDLLLVTPGAGNVRVMRNGGVTGGAPYFKDITSTSGVPASVGGVSRIVVDDWNNDDMNDLFLARGAQPPLVLLKQRGGSLTDSNAPVNWPAGATLATGDLNNDFRTDVVIASANGLECLFGGLTNRAVVPLNGFRPAGLLLTDYDNDGWLDLLAYGDGLRLWRNLGNAGFREATAEAGLDKIGAGKIENVVAADFDVDG